MIALEDFFTTNTFKFFSYQPALKLVKLERGEDNANDMMIFNELKVIVDELMKHPVDFHILDNGDIEIEKL